MVDSPVFESDFLKEFILAFGDEVKNSIEPRSDEVVVQTASEMGNVVGTWKKIFEKLDLSSIFDSTDENVRRIKIDKGNHVLHQTLDLIRDKSKSLYSLLSKIWSRKKLSDDEIQLLANFVILVLSVTESSHFCYTFPCFLKHYPQWPSLNEVITEEKILRFYNAMRIMSTLVKGKLNRELIIRICACVEGNEKNYVTGSGMSKSTQFRVEMFHREFRVPYTKKATTPNSNSIGNSIKIKRTEKVKDSDKQAKRTRKS